MESWCCFMKYVCEKWTFSSSPWCLSILIAFAMFCFCLLASIIATGPGLSGLFTSSISSLTSWNQNQPLPLSYITQKCPWPADHVWLILLLFLGSCCCFLDHDCHWATQKKVQAPSAHTVASVHYLPHLPCPMHMLFPPGGRTHACLEPPSGLRSLEMSFPPLPPSL